MSPHVAFVGLAPTVGDTAIGQSILQGLRHHVGLPIRVYTNRADIFSRLPEVGPGDEILSTLPPRIPIPSDTIAGYGVRHHRLLVDLRSTGGVNRLPPELSTALRSMFETCAGIVFQGGPHWNWMTYERAMQRRYLLEAARFYNVAAYHVGVSCGPFDWNVPARLWMGPLFCNTLDLYNAIFVRDSFSKPSLHHIGVTTNVVDSTDAAVFLEPYADPEFHEVDDRIRRTTKRPRVAVCLRDFQPRYTAAVRHRDAALREMARLLDIVSERLADVYFLGTDHNYSKDKQTDSEIAAHVQESMGTSDSTLIDADVWNPSVLKHFYGQFDAIITMRLHPAILSLGSGVPTLVLSYDPKCSDFVERLGLGEYVIPIQKFSSQSALPMVEKMISDPHLEARIRHAYDQLKQVHAGGYEPMYRTIRERAAVLANKRSSVAS